MCAYANGRVQSACGNLASTGPDDPNEFAMDCLDEKHLLQITAAGMPFGSWYMHGDGGSSLGGFVDFRRLRDRVIHDTTTVRTTIMTSSATNVVAVIRKRAWQPFENNAAAAAAAAAAAVTDGA